MTLRKLFGSRSADGVSAERMAEKYLLGKGLKLIARNYRCRFGEIDLIMLHGDVTVFVEVRLRQSRGGVGSSNDYGGAAASIGPHKQARIIAAAQHYLAGMKESPPCRFDAVLLNQLSEAQLEWMRDAFSA